MRFLPLVGMTRLLALPHPLSQKGDSHSDQREESLAHSFML
ncbi:hypothetical protein [Viscerimonas tarda]